MFKHGDRTNPDNYRPISLASCTFKLFERLIHGCIAPHILPRLDETQGGFRWGADALVYSLVDTLRLRQETHSFCAFVDIRKAFHAAWVEATLIRLAQVGVTGGMWRTITISLSVPFHTSVLMMPTNTLGSTLASLKGAFCPPCFSISL